MILAYPAGPPRQKLQRTNAAQSFSAVEAVMALSTGGQNRGFHSIPYGRAAFSLIPYCHNYTILYSKYHCGCVMLMLVAGNCPPV